MGQILNSLEAPTIIGEIEYPESDGKPIAETSSHVAAIFYLLSALTYYFRNASNVYVGSNMLMYYEEGDPSQFVVPDMFIVKGVPKHDRRTFKLWEERAVPIVIFEITSKSTRYQDIANKRGLYEYLGVREYILFDPLDEYLEPRLQGFRLIEQRYEPIALQADGTLYSIELDAVLAPDGKLLRVKAPHTQETLPTFDEAMSQRQAEAERAEAEADRANAEAERAARAEAELEQLRAEIERLRKQGQE
jgi:Uma2 family endonuclease